MSNQQLEASYLDRSVYSLTNCTDACCCCPFAVSTQICFCLSGSKRFCFDYRYQIICLTWRGKEAKLIKTTKFTIKKRKEETRVRLAAGNLFQLLILNCDIVCFVFCFGWKEWMSNRLLAASSRIILFRCNC